MDVEAVGRRREEHPAEGEAEAHSRRAGSCRPPRRALTTPDSDPSQFSLVMGILKINPFL